MALYLMGTRWVARYPHRHEVIRFSLEQANSRVDAARRQPAKCASLLFEPK